MRGTNTATDKVPGGFVAVHASVLDISPSFQVVEQLRADNQRLKEENGALIRVISKLSK